MIQLYNTLTREKEEFHPIEDNLVKIYSCGPTVYNYAHIGNLRAYIFMDTLRRMLKYNGFKIKHVMNITDVGHLESDADEGEDKMQKAAIRENKDPYEIARFYEKAFLKDLDDLYLAIGSLRYTAGYIINLCSNDIKQVDDILIEKKREIPKINYKSDILVEGTPDIMVNIAKCCMPVKGDDIVGFITKGQGISIHKKNCKNVDIDSDRLIEVSWNMESTNNYYTNIYVIIKDNKDILAEVITEIGKRNSLVRACKTIEKDDKLIYELNIRIKDKVELEHIKKEVRKLSNVIDVTDNL